jgi:hypothetical protein
MHQLILGLADDPAALQVGRHRGADIAIDGEVIETFGDTDGQLVTGTAAGYVTSETQDVLVTESAIVTKPVETREQVAVGYLADTGSGAGYVGIDSSDGTFLWDFLALQSSTQIERARIDVDALAERIDELDSAAIWQVGYDQPGAGGDRVGVRYHADAALRTSGVTQLGFEADFGPIGGVLRGTVAESGYVALYDHGPIETVAEWLRAEILPRAEVPDEDDGQQEVGDD